MTIPVEGMNISEPPGDGEPSIDEAALEEYHRQEDLKAELRKQGKIVTNSPVKPDYRFNPSLALEKAASLQPELPAASKFYDVPLDTAPETMRTGTTANYRMIHLQRLANPTLPWNPLANVGRR